MKKNTEFRTNWAVVTALILFLLEVLTFPIVVYFTYADRSESLCHILTYENRNLSWDKKTDVRRDGSARLLLFDSKYKSAKSSEGDNIVMPGEKMTSIIRLMNNDNETVKYTAVLYRKTTDSSLPVKMKMDGEGFTDTDRYVIPNDIKKSDVIRAVKGEVRPMKLQDFDISWVWDFYEDDYQDMKDTESGNKAAAGMADRAEAGFYIVISAGGAEIMPEPPKTGDETLISGYLVLMAISAVILILLVIDERKKKR